LSAVEVSARPPEREILYRLRRHFSPYSYISSIDEEKSQAQVGIQIQEVIPDYGGNEGVVKVIPLDNVATVGWRYRANGLQLTNLTRSRFVKQVKETYESILDGSQNALLPSLYGKLVRVPQVSLAMSPLRKILSQVSEKETVSENDLGRIPKGDSKASKIPKYFALLSDLEFIKQEDGHYVAGWKMKHLQADEIEPTEVYERILGEVIQRRSRYLSQVLHWTMMVPFLRWSNTYYFPAYEAGRLVRVERGDLIVNYKRFYGTRVATIDANDQIQQIVTAKILKKNGLVFDGMKEIYEGYVSNADKERILEPKPIAR
jgi:hypothetical protein